MSECGEDCPRGLLTEQLEIYLLSNAAQFPAAEGLVRKANSILVVAQRLYLLRLLDQQSTSAKALRR